MKLECKKVRVLILKFYAACVLAVLVCGCENNIQPTNSADKQQQAATEASMAQANSQIGMPAIKNFQERKLAKMIFELRDQEKFVCHAYLVNQMTGEVGQYLGPCVGYGLPYSVQFTNPQKLVDADMGLDVRTFQDNGRVQVLPQPDPNGLFMPEGLSATWLMLIGPDGEAHPVYIEPAIIVSPFPLHTGPVEAM